MTKTEAAQRVMALSAELRDDYDEDISDWAGGLVVILGDAFMRCALTGDRRLMKVLAIVMYENARRFLEADTNTTYQDIPPLEELLQSKPTS